MIFTTLYSLRNFKCWWSLPNTDNAQVPKSTYTQPAELTKLSKAYEENKRRAEVKHM